MPVAYKRNLIVFSGIVTVDDAEGLHTWLQKKSNAKADLSACTHLHPANLQLLLAASVKISVWPQDATLSGWLQSSLMHE